MQSFRETFSIPHHKCLQWYPGHMEKGLKVMERKLKSVDCILEVHDARIPLSGRNKYFQRRLVSVKPHVLVLNKIDLADMSDFNLIENKLMKYGTSKVIPFSTHSNTGEKLDKLRQVLHSLVEAVNSQSRFNRQHVTSYNFLVMGVPNVGKSTILNCMRNFFIKKRKSAQVGAIAGVTRSVSEVTKILENPPMYMLDSPGILPPKFDTLEEAMNLAACSCLNDDVVGYGNIADYVLYTLNKKSMFSYVDYYNLDTASDNIQLVLAKIAIKENFFKKVRTTLGSLKVVPDVYQAAIKFVKDFRKGLLGKLVFDEL